MATMKYGMNDRGMEHFKIMDIEKIGGWDAALWETTMCGVHFMFSVQFAGQGHYFASAQSALEWAGEERQRRIKQKRRLYSERYYNRHRT